MSQGMLGAVWPGGQGHQLHNQKCAGQPQRRMEVQDLQNHATHGVKKEMISPTSVNLLRTQLGFI